MSLAERRDFTSGRLDQLRADLASAEELAKGKASVYATGSYGRGEAGQHSDLDLFILGKSKPDGKRQLTQLNEICIKAELIHVTRKFGIPEFSGDGQYLEHFSVTDLIKTLGTQQDDVANTFTARLLLLLESCSLVGSAVYQVVIEEVLRSYWRDFEDHKTDFMPAFLTNDILRLWRTFCVNYEARTSREPAEKKAKGKLKNYKLKHSRMLTCFSAILQLLAIYEMNGTVTPANAQDVIFRTPTQRIEWLMEQAAFSDAHKTLRSLLDQYEMFLDATNDAEGVLVERFLDPKSSKGFMQAAYKFGDLTYEAMKLIGREKPFFRLIIV